MILTVYNEVCIDRVFN